MNDNITTEIAIHSAGPRIAVGAGGETIWMTVPISTDGTATITVYLNPTDCLRVAELLKRAGDRGMRIRAAAAEPTPEPIEAQL